MNIKVATMSSFPGSSRFLDGSIMQIAPIMSAMLAQRMVDGGLRRIQSKGGGEWNA
ncbi:MAG TPA: hypothetical protein VFI49_14550 [Rudaea sp.]|nr:hypothetical protein [Rudaea sp.]